VTYNSLIFGFVIFAGWLVLVRMKSTFTKEYTILSSSGVGEQINIKKGFDNLVNGSLKITLTNFTNSIDNRKQKEKGRKIFKFSQINRGYGISKK
jgi:hypothetical protein